MAFVIVSASAKSFPTLIAGNYARQVQWPYRTLQVTPPAMLMTEAAFRLQLF